MDFIYGPTEHVGGAIIVNKDKYIYAGMENEQYYGWGPEDFDRYARWKIFNFKIHRSTGPIYHLTHPRDINGEFNSKYQQEYANGELHRTRSSSVNELLNKTDS